MKRVAIQTIFFVVSVYAICRPTIIHIPIEYPTIQQGIGASVDGDTVLVQPGVYLESVHFLGHDITLASLFLTTGDTSYISQTIIDGGSVGTVIFVEYCDTLAAVIGLSIRNGNGSFGGGLKIDHSDPRINHNIIHQNAALFGGGIACENLSHPVISYNIIENNSAEYLGGGIYNGGNSNPDVFSNIIRENSSDQDGGGLYNVSHVDSNAITSNSSERYGGGVLCSRSTFLRNNSITYNTSGSGGGVYSGEYCFPQLYNNEIDHNVASDDGGGICVEEDGGIINGNTITYNTADNGGGIYAFGYARPEIEQNTISNNTAVEGAGIFCDSLNRPIITANIIIDNIASGFGGGIKLVRNSEAAIDSNEISGNRAASGAGIFCISSHTSSISNNRIADNIGGGIKIYYLSVEISGNKITGNSNPGLGGGIFCVGNHLIANNVFFENSALKGGALYVVNSNSAVIRNNVSYRNSASWGGGIYCAGTNPLISNTIFWSDSAGIGNEIYIENGSPEITYCDVQGGFAGEGNVDLDPRFRNPEEYDLHLMSADYGYPYDSPCIDIGNPADLDSLLAEFWGLGTAYCDMGAYGGGERQGSIINVPADFPTIQQGVDAADQNDTVLVYPGVYTENVEIGEAQIWLGSLFMTTGDTSYISTTIIDGDSSGSTIRFWQGREIVPKFAGFTVRNGYSHAGGGIFCYQSSPEISFNRITDNISGDGGGAIHCEGHTPLIHDNVIDFNLENGYWGGGGIFCLYSDALIYNNKFVNNTSTSRGGALSFLNCDPIIINNTISNNSAEIGGGLYIINSHPTIENSIFWADSASSDSNEIYNNYGEFNVSYCNIRGGWPGQGNIDINPLFRDTAAGDYHLMSTACGDPFDSPCIDAGDLNLFDQWLDCDRGLGIWRSDMGAYGGSDSVITSIIDDSPEVPDKFILSRNYPNPFNARTTISFVLPEGQDVLLTVYDLLGRQVQVLTDLYLQAGVHDITFDASRLSSGVYFYRLEAGRCVEKRKMLLLK